MKVWLSRRPNGTYMVTALPPIVEKVRGANYCDIYIRPGDRLGILDLCSAVTRAALREAGMRELAPFESIKTGLSLSALKGSQYVTLKKERKGDGPS